MALFKWPEELMFMKNSRAKQKTSDEMMTGKTCVISGSSSGVGKETMRSFAERGANIVMVVRNHEKAQAVKDEIVSQYQVNIDIIIADFSDLESVRHAAQLILDKYPKIDVLVNSAGIHSTKKTYNKDGIEMVFCVNHLATFLFSMLLLDRIKESAPSRIIQVNSEGHRFGHVKIKDVNFKRRLYTGLKSYGASKTAQLYTVYELASRLEGTGVTINAMHPGAVKTHIGSNNGWLYRWFFRHFTWHFLKDVKISGSAIHYLATAKELDQVSGKFFNLTIEETPARHAVKKDMQKPVWDLSMSMSGLKD
ncbi:MAG: SDR family NAD(P)-dependent oxidoreductase [Acholeplasmataceae bacterium]|nr:SDR family NAD(P)-dependent oxidoreductase [Acholeplasmataceae bacterium]